MTTLKWGFRWSEVQILSARPVRKCPLSLRFNPLAGRGGPHERVAPRRQSHQERGRDMDRGGFGALVRQPMPHGPAKTLHQLISYAFSFERARRQTLQQPPSGLNRKLSTAPQKLCGG